MIALAQFLEHHPKVGQLYYLGLSRHPQHKLAKQQISGFSRMICLEIGDSFADVERFVARLKVISLAESFRRGRVFDLLSRPNDPWRYS